MVSLSGMSFSDSYETGIRCYATVLVVHGAADAVCSDEYQDVNFVAATQARAHCCLFLSPPVDGGLGDVEVRLGCIAGALPRAIETAPYSAPTTL